MTSYNNPNPGSLREKDPMNPPASMQTILENANRDFLLQLAVEMDCKELPAPPPPSPEYRTAHICQPIDELSILTESDIAEPTERKFPNLDASAKRNVAFSHHSGSRNSPLRQVSRPIDVDPDSMRAPSPGRNCRRECAMLREPFSNRRVTLPDSSGRDRSSSASSLQGVPKSTSRHASPAFNMAYLRSTIHGIPTTTRGSIFRSPSESCSRPSLKGRQISSPIITDQPPSPTLFDFPRPVTPSTTSQSRSESMSTQSSEPLSTGELVSYFSDSEEEGKNSKRSSLSKKGSSEKGDSRGRSRRFRRRLSGTFAFLSCGTERSTS